MTDRSGLDDSLTPDAVVSLAERSVRAARTTAFQGLLVAALDTVRTLRCPLTAAGEAALSLAHQQTVGAVVEDLDALAVALRTGVTSQGACLMPARPRPADWVRLALRPSPGWLPRLRQRASGVDVEPRPTWVMAMATAVEALGDVATRIGALGEAQPDGSAARDLGRTLSARLMGHRDTLLAEVARLVD